MGNMSYCRFENTSSDLRDCEEYIGEIEEMNNREFEAMIKLLRTCKNIADEYGEDEIEEFEKEFKAIGEEEI